MDRRNQMVGYVYILPTFILLGLILFFPYIFAIYLSFQSVSPTLEMRFIGFANFLRALNDPIFWVSLWNVLIIVVASEAGGFILGLAGALALKRGGVTNSLWRIVLLLPWAVPGVVASLIWILILDGNFGILNQMLVALGLTRHYISLLGNNHYALMSVVMVNIWRGFPFILVMLLAGLQAIPAKLYEAAAIDGANPWHQFRYITLPSLNQVIAITLILTTIWNFKIFDLVWILTGGGPGYATEVLSTLIYRTSFRHLDFGYASSIAILMALVIIVPIIGYIHTISKKEF